MPYAGFAEDEQRRAMLPRKLDGADAVDVELIVSDLEKVIYLPGRCHGS